MGSEEPMGKLDLKWWVHDFPDFVYFLSGKVSSYFVLKKYIDETTQTQNQMSLMYYYFYVNYALI